VGNEASGSRLLLYLTATAVQALKRHKERQPDGFSEWVFCSTVGTPINCHNLINRSWKPLLRDAGLPLDTRFHDLRHTCATVLLSRNVHPKYVQELLGHANIATTLDTYSHVIPGMGNHAARAMEDALS
jgi:integrase